MADSRARGYGLTLAVGLLAATAVTVGVSRPWVSATATVPGMPTLTDSVSGADLTPLAGALGVVLLASFGAVIATGGWVRRGLGALIALCSAAVGVAAISPGSTSGLIEEGLSAKGWATGGYDSEIVFWRWIVLAGALLCLAAGLSIVRFGARWATMGARYDAPTASPPPLETAATELDETAVWKAIDRGHDPTQAP